MVISVVSNDDMDFAFLPWKRLNRELPFLFLLKSSVLEVEDVREMYISLSDRDDDARCDEREIFSLSERDRDFGESQSDAVKES